MSMEESISLEETNKIRISLGLKPLTDDSAPADNADKKAEENYHARREQEQKDREAKKIQDRIAKVRNRRELNASLKGATLGDADADVDDVKKWLKKSKKAEKELAKKRMQELENMDKVFQGDEYTEKDLVGLKVSHDFDQLEEGDDRILTLKDSRILDNEEDELQNVEMAEHERTKKVNDMKIKNRTYTGYDDEEFVEGKQGLKRSVLSKYDIDINGEEEAGFRLGSSVMSTAATQIKKKEETAKQLNKSLLSIDYDKNLATADYLKEGDVGFKKPKTKKKRPTRRANGDVEAGLVDPDAMSVDEKPIIPVERERNLDTNFIDDDELQAALARSRRAKLNKPKKLSPEELAKKIAAEREMQEAVREVIVINGDDGEGLEFDDTSEFVRAIAYNPTAVKKEPKPEPVESRTPSVPQTRDISMGVEDRPIAEVEMEAGELDIKEENEEEDEMAMLNAIESVIKETEKQEAEADDGVGTSSEQTFSSGMASTLNILRSQGILAASSANQVDRERTQLQRDLWLAEQRRRVAQRELERLQGRGGNKDQATREYENRLRDQQEARDNLEAFKNYKPDVNIVYYDEFGRTLTPKEAWKALSHKFHGKGSGKMKTEKRLKKIAEEKKQEAMASGDTPLSMNKAFQIRQEKTGQAHFVLSVGNRGAVPQAAEFLDAQPLSKSKTEKKAKKQKASTSKATEAEPDSGFMTLPAPSAPSSQPQSHAGSPAPRPGFSRIGSMAEPKDTGSGAGTPATERTKVAINFGTKRKADVEAEGSPQPKSSKR